MAARAVLIGPSSAAALLGRSVPYVRWLGLTGKLTPARTRSTMKFRLDDVIKARELFPRNPNERRGRPKSTNLVKFMTEVLS